MKCDILTRDEEEALYHRMTDGDDGARDALASSVWEWACKCVYGNSLSKGYSDWEVDSTAGMAIMLALKTYHPDKGRLTTLVYYAVRSTLMDESRNRGVIHVPEQYFSPNKQQRFPEQALAARRMRSLDRPIVAGDRRREVLLRDTIPDRRAEPDVTFDDEAEILTAACEKGLEYVKRHSPQAETLLRLRIFEGKTQREAGQAIGVRRARASQIEKEWLPVMQREARKHIRGCTHHG